MVVNALTHKGANIENCLRTPVKIANPSNAQTIESLGIWDTGATNSVITKAVARNTGDFCITNFDNKTVLTFRTPSLTKIDYVEEIAEHKKYLKVYQIQHQHGNDRCPCGSNKLYKNCHGHSIYNK